MKLRVFKPLSLALIFTLILSCSTDDSEIYMDQDQNKLVLPAVKAYTQIEIDILKLVNDHRESIGIAKLASLDIVSNVADQHTAYMITNGTVSHDNFVQRVDQLTKNANAKKVGENVAYGYGTAKGVVNGWLKSDGHRKVIENTDYTHFGISTDTNSENRNYFTQIFIKK